MGTLPESIVKIIAMIEAQKALMIDIATHKKRIEEHNTEYIARRRELRLALTGIGLDDPNPHPDLWALWGKCDDGSLKTYQSRRIYIRALYQSSLDYLDLGSLALQSQQLVSDFAPVSREPTPTEGSEMGSGVNLVDGLHVSLRKTISESFSLAELRVLCHDMGIDHEEFRYEGKSDFIVSLMSHCQRRGLKRDLLKHCKASVPDKNWSEFDAWANG